MISRIFKSKAVWVLVGFMTRAVSAPLIVPAIVIVSWVVGMAPASVAMQAISQLTFVPCPKRRRVSEIMPSVWMVPNFLLIARPRVPKAWAVVRSFALLFWMVFLCWGWSCWVSGCVNPVTWVTMTRFWFLKSFEAWAPVLPVVVATTMFFMLSWSALCFASCRVCWVFWGPGFSK